MRIEAATSLEDIVNAGNVNFNVLKILRCLAGRSGVREMKQKWFDICGGD